MRSKLSNLAECGIPAFRFAGFQFPKHVWTLPRGTMQKRLRDRKSTFGCGDYYHAPKPISGHSNGMGFYLDSDGQPFGRWMYCDDVNGANIHHTGWFCDEFQDSKIRGIVARLPHGRGFLAGWTMGESMASEVDAYVYDDEVDAARAADSLAEQAAERQREFEQEERERLEQEEVDAE